MNEVLVSSHFCNEAQYCPMRLDLENAPNKLVFLRNNWPDLWEFNKISSLSMKNLKCSLCVTNIVINALANEEICCPNREIIRLVTTQMYIQNTYELHKLQEELSELIEKQKIVQGV